MRGFTLIELVVVLLVLAILASALALPISAQVSLRRHDEARRMMDEARDALLGFAAAHGRLPCPANAASLGQEAFAPVGNGGNGECADFHAGFLPAAALGLASLDADGLLRDPWGQRLRYAVAAVDVNGVARALTRANGLAMAGLAGIGGASHYLLVCASGTGTGAASCGPAANQLTRRAAFVLLSSGPNGGVPAAGVSDEARNADGNGVFVAREASGNETFDDVVQWGSIHLLVNRMIVAGRLP
jgi:prepilin-type N-terminal cleavage/methylation domain-containing protein